MRAQAGFTLVEVIVAIMLAGVLAAGSVGLLTSAVRAYDLQRDAADLTLKGGNAMRWLGAQVREATAMTQKDAANKYLEFQTVENAATVTKRVTYNAASKKLVMTIGGANFDLLDEVNAFTIQPECANLKNLGGSETRLIKISLSSQGAPPITLDVYPRNLLGCPP